LCAQSAYLMVGVSWTFSPPAGEAPDETSRMERATMSLTGRPRWYRPDTGLAARMVLTIFLLGLVYVVFGTALWYFFRLPIFGLVIIALVIAGAQLFFADKIALGSMGAREVSEAEAPDLHDLIGRLAMQANLPKPKIAIVNSSIPNAFATGRDKDHAVV